MMLVLSVTRRPRGACRMRLGLRRQQAHRQAFGHWVANRLEKLGSEVTRPVSLPDWSVDELMLALNLYLLTRGQISYCATTKVVTDLITELRSLRIFPEELRTVPRFRNASGVALKLHNFSSIDPAYEGKGVGHGAVGD